MKYFSSGNVIKTQEGRIEIVIKVESDGYATTIPIDSTNTFIGRRQLSYTKKERCACGSCEYCQNNNGHYIETINGMDSVVIVANTIKDWIIESTTKNFLNK